MENKGFLLLDIECGASSTLEMTLWVLSQMNIRGCPMERYRHVLFKKERYRQLTSKCNAAKSTLNEVHRLAWKEGQKAAPRQTDTSVCLQTGLNHILWKTRLENTEEGSKA